MDSRLKGSWMGPDKPSHWLKASLSHGIREQPCLSTLWLVLHETRGGLLGKPCWQQANPNNFPTVMGRSRLEENVAQVRFECVVISTLLVYFVKPIMSYCPISALSLYPAPPSHLPHSSYSSYSSSLSHLSWLTHLHFSVWTRCGFSQLYLLSIYSC